MDCKVGHNIYQESSLLYKLFIVKCEPFFRLTSQCAYPVIIHNLVITPIWSYRVFFGPLNWIVADFAISTGNACVSWVLLCLTEALVIRAIMITSYKNFSGVDDMFVSTFIFLVNLGFSFGSHIGLCVLGLYSLNFS